MPTSVAADGKEQNKITFKKKSGSYNCFIYVKNWHGEFVIINFFKCVNY